MTSTGNEKDFGKSGHVKRIDKLFTDLGEHQVDPEEVAIARVAYESRRSETLVPISAALITYAALAVAIMSAVDLNPWMGMTIGVIGAVALFATMRSAQHAGENAAAQAVLERRQADMLAAQSTVHVTQPASRTSDKALAAVAVTAIAGAATIAAAALLRRPH